MEYTKGTTSYYNNTNGTFVIQWQLQQKSQPRQTLLHQLTINILEALQQLSQKKTSITSVAMCTWKTTTVPYKPARKLLTILHQQWGQQMTPTSTKAKPTTTKSPTIMSITQMSTTVAITTMNTTVETKPTTTTSPSTGPSSQLVLQSLQQQSSTKCNNNYHKGNGTVTVKFSHKYNYNNSNCSSIEPFTTVNTKL
jgi:hypothetical protein